MRKKWVFGEYDKDKCASLAEECGISVFSALILYSRGFDTKDKINAFFSDDLSLSDPFCIKDMDKAAECIMQAVENGSRICVYGDYDADGVTAVTVLYSYLDAIGADVVYYIPDRITEGYGFHPEAVEKIAENGVELIVTVDTGINAFEGVEKAKQLGLNVVITDHHQPSETLPQAYAVVDPHRADDTSRLDYLAGVGVAFKLVCALENGNEDSVLYEYAQFVTIGTIADIVPVIGENRKIINIGLETINSSPAPGIGALLKTASVAEKTINSGHIAYSLSPRINAAGRMGSAETALKLLLSDTDENADYYAQKLEEKNTERHSAEAAVSSDIKKILNENPSLLKDNIIVVSGRGWNEGVIGIAASRITDIFGKPSIVITQTENGTAKGSCRSIGDFSVYDALEYCSDILSGFGGHTLAAGCSLDYEKIGAFRKKINEYASRNIPDFSSVRISCKLNPTGISTNLLDALEQLEPYGMGNPKPVFAFCGMTVSAVRPIGGGKHIRLELTRGNLRMQAVKFGVSENAFQFNIGDNVDIAAVVEKNEYNGKITPSIQIKEIKFSDIDDNKLFDSYYLYKKIESGINVAENEKQLALPSRGVIAQVYKCIKLNGGPGCTDEFILKQLKLEEKYICRISVCLSALTDSGLISADDSGFRIIPNAPKADLTKIPILSSLGYIG